MRGNSRLSSANKGVYTASFAAGAMIFVVVEELIPESHRNENHDLATLGALAGFTVMMVLDVAFR